MHAVILLTVTSFCAAAAAEDLTTVAVGTTSPRPPGGITNCSYFEKADADDELNVCIAAADSSVVDSIYSQQEKNLATAAIANAICKAINAKLDCYKKILPKCHDDIYLQDSISYLMFQELKYAHNQSTKVDSTGSFLLRNCPLMKESEARVVKWKLGSNNCSYMDMSEAIQKYDNCIEDLNNYLLTIRDIESYLGSRVGHQSYFTRLCINQREKENCLTKHECLSPEKKANIEKENQNFFIKKEKKMQEEEGYPDFSYAICPQFLNRTRTQLE